MWIGSHLQILSRLVYICKLKFRHSQKKSKRKLQRPRKHSDGTKLRLKNAYGIFEYDVTIVSAKYDGAAHTWMYTLKDYDLKPIAKQYPETDLDC